VRTAVIMMTGLLSGVFAYLALTPSLLSFAVYSFAVLVVVRCGLWLASRL